MLLRMVSALLMGTGLAVCCGAQPVQAPRTFTIRVMDSHNGKVLAVSNVLIRINHDKAVHADWVVPDEDLTGKVTVPAGATEVAAQATYNHTMELYINCDSVKAGQPGAAHWYQVSEILAKGVVAVNGCSKRTEAEKPGELVLFVRTKNWRDSMDQDFSE